MMIPGDPYDFPIEGPLLPGKTALIIIDMQRDFCAPSCDLLGRLFLTSRQSVKLANRSASKWFTPAKGTAPTCLTYPVASE